MVHFLISTTCVVHFISSTTCVVHFLFSTTCVVGLLISTTCVVGLLISTTCVVDCPRTLIFLLLFFNLKTLTIADLVQFKSMVLMYKIYNNLMPSNILSYFCMVHMSLDHDTRQAGHFKNMYCRTTLKSMCLSVRGPVMWNKLHTDLKNSTKKRYKTFLVSEYAIT